MVEEYWKGDCDLRSVVDEVDDTSARLPVVYYFMSYNAIKCSREHNIFDIYPEHFALFVSFAVCDFSHRKERKVRKDLFKLFGF